MTAQHGTTTTSSIGWYGSYSDESGDYCEPFDQELYESQLRQFILVGSTGKPSRLFSESQHPCGSASFVYSRKNEAVVKKESPIKEIVKEKKVKKAIPMRAKNDPRQKN